MKTMKCLSAGVFVLAAAWVVPAIAQNSCSDRTLFGQYSSVIDGRILTGPLAGLDNGVTLETFDGNGHFTGIDHVVLNGVQPAAEWRYGSTGTYEVNSNCTGKKVVTFLNNTPPPRITYFVITAGGKQMNWVSGNEGVALSGVAVRSVGTGNDQ